MLGHRLAGLGPARTIVLNDWLGDTTSWDAILPMLTYSPVTWALADLRGYGRSRELAGERSVEEAADDVAALATSLGWQRFSVVGHSMSSLVALHLGQHAPERVASAVVLCPPAPQGMGYGDDTLAALRAVALGSDELRARALSRLVGEHAPQSFVRWKVTRWRETSSPEAVAAWLEVFGRRGLPRPERAVGCPLLAITGALDAPPMRAPAVTRLLSPMAADLEVVELTECGHYPMQEAPPRLLGVLERFLAARRS
jgi:3-oxoadipate enol-lactonase